MVPPARLIGFKQRLPIIRFSMTRPPGKRNPHFRCRSMPTQYRLMALHFYATVRKTAGMKQSSPLNQPFVRYQARDAPLTEKYFRRHSSEIFPIARRGVIL